MRRNVLIICEQGSANLQAHVSFIIHRPPIRWLLYAALFIHLGNLQPLLVNIHILGLLLIGLCQDLHHLLQVLGGLVIQAMHK